MDLRNAAPDRIFIFQAFGRCVGLWRSRASDLPSSIGISGGSCVLSVFHVLAPAVARAPPTSVDTKEHAPRVMGWLFFFFSGRKEGARPKTGLDWRAAMEPRSSSLVFFLAVQDIRNTAPAWKARGPRGQSSPCYAAPIGG